MIRGHQLVGAVHGYVYNAQVPASRPVSDYTPRVIPYHPDAIIPLEAAQILWQR
jgi:starch phosphorylase